MRRVRRLELVQLEHRAHERKGRLCPLVAVHAIRLQTVEAIADHQIEDRLPRVVASEKPRTRTAHGFCPHQRSFV